MTKLADGYVELRSDPSRFRTEAREQIRRVLDGVKARVNLIPDDSQFRLDVTRAVEKAAAGQEVGVGLDLDALGLRQKVKAETTAAGVGNDVKVGVDVDRNALDQLGQSLRGSAGGARGLSSALGLLKWPVLISGAGTAAGVLGSLTAGAIALTASLGPVVGLVGALPAGLLAGGGAAGVLKLGLGGVGDALKAMSAAEKEAGASAKDAAEEAATANERRLDTARRVQLAIRGVRTAEEDLESTLRDEAEAQRDLTQARRDAERQLLDLQDALDQSVLSEEAAINAKARAIEEERRVRSDPRSSELDRREAELAVRQASENLDQAQKRKIDDAHELARARAAGVDGAAQVVSAEEQLAEIQKRARDQAVGIADAQYELAKASRDAAKAAAEMGDGTSAAAEKARTALEGLTPAGRRFAEFLHSLRPELDGLKGAASSAFLPGLERGIRSALGVVPVLRTHLSELGGVMGEVAARGGQMISTGPFRADLAAILRTNVGLMDRVGRSSLNFGDGLRHVTIAAEPLVDRLGRLVLRLSETFRSSAEAGRESGRLSAFFERTADVVDRLVSITGSLWRIMLSVGKAARPLGDELFEAFDKGLRAKADFFESFEGQNSLRRFFDEARPVLYETGRLIRDIVRAFFDFGRNANTAGVIRSLRTQLLPALVRMADVASDKLLPAVIGLATHFIELVTRISGSGGGLVGIVTALDRMAQVILFLIDEVPGFGAFVGTLVTMGATMKAFQFVAWATGLSSIGKAMLGISTAAKGEGLVGKFLGHLRSGAPTAAGAGLAQGAAGKAAGGAGGGAGGAAQGAAGAGGLGAFSGGIGGTGVLGGGLIAGAVIHAGVSVRNLIRDWDDLKATFADKGAFEGSLGLLKSMFPIGAEFREKVIRQIAEGAGELPGALSRGVDRFPEILGRGAQHLVGFVGQIPGWFAAGLGQVPAIFDATVGRLPELAGAGVGRMAEAGGRLMGSLANGIATHGPRVLEFISSVPERIGRFFAGAGGWLLNAGKQIITGLVRGIRSLGGDVAKALFDVATTPVRAFIKFIDPGSPSKLFTRLGESIGQGLSLGINRSSANVAKSFEALKFDPRALSNVKLPGLTLGDFDPSIASGAIGALKSGVGGGAHRFRTHPDIGVRHESISHDDRIVIEKVEVHGVPERVVRTDLPAAMRAQHYLTGGKWRP